VTVGGESAALRSRTRLRPTPAAWRLAWIGLGLLGAAANTGNNLIYLSFSLLAAAGLVSAALAIAQARRLRCTLRLPAAPVAGAPFVCDLELTNGGRWLAARAVEVGLVASHDLCDRVLVQQIAAGASIRLAVPARGAPRGPLRIRGVMLRSRFPLTLFELRVLHEQPVELLVLPRCDAGVDRLALGTGAEGEGASSRRLPGSEILGLRRGRDEDDARAIDWKVTARRGTLIVRETAGDGRIELSLRLETRLGGDPVAARRTFETRVSRIAGLSRLVLLGGGAVRLSIDDGSEERYVGAELPRLLRRLAALEAGDERGVPLPPPPVPARAAAEAANAEREARPDRAERVLRRSALAATAIGSSALFAFGAIGILAAAALAVGLTATAFFPGAVAARTSLAGRAWQVAALAALPLFCVDLAWLRHDLLATSSALLVFVTSMALFNARDAADDRRLLLISLVLIVLAAALTTEPAFALPLLAWLVACVRGLMAACLLPDGPRVRLDVVPAARDTRPRDSVTAAGLALATAAVGAAVFSLVPHIGTGTFRPTTLRRQAISGFSEATTLGDIGRIKLDGTKVMEVTIEGGRAAEDDLRWRGVALTRFDGRTWTRAAPAVWRVAADARGRLVPRAGDAPLAAAASRSSLVQEIRLEPLDSTAVFAAFRPRHVVSRDLRRLVEDREGNLELPAGPRRRLKYTVTSNVPAHDAETLRHASGEDPPQILARHRSLPRLDPRIPALAHEITAGAASRYDAALAIERWLAGRLRYSLVVGDVGAPDPIARFLFEGAPGHCEYFATAMVVLARSAGIPSRFVAGYLRGERSRLGRRYVVRQSDAHSWVEVFFPGIGWAAFDPTPPVGRSVSEARGLGSQASFLYSSVTRLWDDYVVGADLDDQARALLGLVDGTRTALAAAAALPRSAWLTGLAAAAALTAAVLASRAHRRRRARPPGIATEVRPPPRFYRQLLALLDGRGLQRRPEETAAELAERARHLLGPRGADRLGELTRLYYRVRFDGATTERSVHGIARALLDDVREELRAESSNP